jgi:hypothetical protein
MAGAELDICIEKTAELSALATISGALASWITIPDTLITKSKPE